MTVTVYLPSRACCSAPREEVGDGDDEGEADGEDIGQESLGSGGRTAHERSFSKSSRCLALNSLHCTGTPAEASVAGLSEGHASGPVHALHAQVARESASTKDRMPRDPCWRRGAPSAPACRFRTRKDLRWGRWTASGAPRGHRHPGPAGRSCARWCPGPGSRPPARRVSREKARYGVQLEARGDVPERLPGSDERAAHVVVPDEAVDKGDPLSSANPRAAPTPESGTGTTASASTASPAPGAAPTPPQGKTTFPNS